MKKFLFSLFLIFFSTLSATAHAAEYASEELITKFSKYIHSIDPDVECKLLRKVTPQELCQGLRPIALVESQMPWTHTLKKMLSGKKNGKRVLSKEPLFHLPMLIVNLPAKPFLLF